MGRIVVGTDLSPRSDRGLLRAVAIARATGSEIVLVSVLAPEQGSAGEQEQRSAAATLRQLQGAITAREGIACHYEVRSGDPATELTRAAEEAAAELMVIGPDRRGFFRDAFGTVTAERIVRAATVPLIIAKGSPWPAYRNILVPVDLSTSAQAIVRNFTALPLSEGTAMTLLHVYDPQAREMLGRSLTPTSQRKAYRDDCARCAEDDLRDFAEATGQSAASLRSEETSGPVWTTLMQVAREAESDLIVVSPSGKGFLGRHFLGSTTEDIIRSSLVDVLVLPRLTP